MKLAAARRRPGVPANNASYFCNGNATTCYSVLTTIATWDAQRAICQGLGGDLVSFIDIWEQVLVSARSHRGIVAHVHAQQAPLEHTDRPGLRPEP